MAKAKGAVSQGLQHSSPTTAKERWRQVQAVFALQNSGIPSGSQWRPGLAVFLFPRSPLLCGMLNIGLSSYLELALTLRWILARQHNRRKSRPFIPKVVSFRIGRNQPAADSATPNAELLPSAPRPRKNHQGD